MHLSTGSHFACLLIGLLLTPVSANAETPKDSGTAAAKCVSVSGVLLAQGADGKWQAVRTGESVPSGRLLVGMPRAELTSPAGDVKLLMLADIANRGMFPVLEAGVILHDAHGADLDVTFARGLMVLESLKSAGEAKVRLRSRQ